MRPPRSRALAGAALALVVLASLPVLFAPHPGGGAGLQHLDKFVHAGLFGALAAAGWWRFGRWRAVAAAVAGYALLSELVQAVALPGRSGDPADLLADVGGAAAVLLLVRLAVGAQTFQTWTTEGRG